MSSRWFLLFTLLILSACTPSVGEDPPPTTNVEISGTDCLSDTGEILKKFFRGEAKNAEVYSGFTCIETAFDKFTKYVRGRNQDRYYPNELSQFFETYFIAKNASGQPINKITPAFESELMKIKQLLVGGSREYVTRQELNTSKNIIARLRDLAVEANPFMKVYVLNWSPTGDFKSDYDLFENSNLKLQELAQVVAEFIVPEHQPYMFQDFMGLLEEMGQFYNEKFPFVETANQYMPLIHKVKKTVAGGAEDSIGPGEWRSFFLLGARAYVQFSRYHYFLTERPELGTSINLNYISRAVEDLFSTFEDLVREKPESGTRRSGGRGDPNGKITREELKELLMALSQTWPSFKISDPLLDEVMALKQVVFGGTQKDWSYRDFANAKLKVGKLKPLLEKFLPYYRIYIFEWDPSQYSEEAAPVYFREAEENLHEVLSELGKLLEAPYSLSRVQNLLNEIENLYPTSRSDTPLNETFRKYYPVILSAKNILYEDKGDQIDKKYWPTFLSFGSRIYSFYLNYHYFLKEPSLEEPRVLMALRYLVDSSLDTATSILKTKPSHVLKNSELLRLAVEIQKVGVIPAELKEDSIAKLIQATSNNLLNPPARRIKGGKVDYLDQASFENLREELSVWVENEIFLRGIFGSGGNKITLAPFELQQRIDEKLLDPQMNPYLRVGIGELKRIISSPVPLVVDPTGRMLISTNTDLEYDGESISRLNLTRAASRVMIRAYAEDERRVEGFLGISKEEANKAFVDLKWPFIDLKILDPKNTTFVDSRFLEANIFVPRADGNEYAGFLELSDLLSMILSGIKLDSLLRPDLLKECLPQVSEPSTSDTVDYMCLLNNYKRNIPLYLTSMPSYIYYFNRNDSCDMEMAFFNIIKAAGYVPESKMRVELGDIALLPHVIQYLEMAYAKFDINKDGFFDRHDAKKAFPTFEKLFKDLAKDYIKSGMLSEKDLYPLFTFVLKEGKVPENVGDFLKFMVWKNKSESNRNFTADRNKLSAILGVVADKVGKNAQFMTAEARSTSVTSKHFSPRCRDRFIIEPPPSGESGPL